METKCGLKRYEIGEIASRIAQLYYHYYLRTSDTSHLLDSFMFYQAVRERGYFAKIADEGRCVLGNGKSKCHLLLYELCPNSDTGRHDWEGKTVRLILWFL